MAVSPINRTIVSQVLLCCVGLSTLSGQSLSAPQNSTSLPGSSGEQHAVLFEEEVAPIIRAYCLRCHGLEGRHAELDLRTMPLIRKGGGSGVVVVPGLAERSLLFQVLTPGERQERHERAMGEVEQGSRQGLPRLRFRPTSNHANVIGAWINAGARARDTESVLHPEQAPPLTDEDRQWWSFRKPVRPPVPLVNNEHRVRNPLDAFLLNRLEEKGLSFSNDAGPEVLVRRVYLDLVGFPPTPAAINTYLNDHSPDRYERLIDQLLASPHYGVKWGRHWLDAAGYTDVVGHDDLIDSTWLQNGIWRYRDYVIGSWNADKPFDRFLLEQIAGDELVEWRDAETYSPEIIEHLVATGFLRLARDQTHEQVSDRIIHRENTLVELLTTFGTGVLGLTIQCSQCHSHKYEPISQLDYYRFRSLFTPAYNPQDWRHSWGERFESETFREDSGPGRYLHVITEKQYEKIQASNDAIDVQIAALKEQLPSEPDDKHSEQVTEIELAVNELQRRKQRPELVQALWDVGPPPPQYLLTRGDYERPGVEVTAGVFAVLDDPQSPFTVPVSGPDARTSGYRTALGRWLIRADHPLTARVFMNRVWQRYFERGIVETTGNFGQSGSLPSHPKLLDWLATEFVSGGWKLKRMHRLILTSTAYRQSSTRSGDSQSAGPAVESVKGQPIDPDNRLLWKMPLRRIDSEVLRDSILAVSGTLNSAMGGPPVVTLANDDGTALDFHGDALADANDEFRRSVYLVNRRNYSVTTLKVFDQPVMATNCTQREESAVVLQSLTLLNDSFIQQQAAAFADRVYRMAGQSESRRILVAFRLALGRHPDAREMIVSRDLLREQANLYHEANTNEDGPPAADLALTELCHMLLSTNEFLYIR